MYNLIWQGGQWNEGKSTMAAFHLSPLDWMPCPVHNRLPDSAPLYSVRC